MTAISSTQEETRFIIDGHPVTAIFPCQDTSDTLNHIRRLLISSFAASRNGILAQPELFHHNTHKGGTA